MSVSSQPSTLSMAEWLETLDYFLSIQKGALALLFTCRRIRNRMLKGTLRVSGGKRPLASTELLL